MSAVSHGTRHLRQGIGGNRYHIPGVGPARSLHAPAFLPPLRTPQPSTAQRIFTNSRNLISKFFAHLTTPGLVYYVPSAAPSRSLVRPAHFHSTAQSVKASYSLPVRNALYRPLSVPRLPRAPSIPSNVANVGLGAARSFHSARPIFQNVIDNVPIATRALWEVEWEVKAKRKEELKLRKAKNHVASQKTREMLKPKSKSIAAEIPIEVDSSEIDHYFSQPVSPQVMTYLQVPLAPTPTARLPLSAQSTTGVSVLHPLLPVSDVAVAHWMHRDHSLRVSTLFSRLGAANVWADPCVKVDAYAFGPRVVDSYMSDRQCTVLRVTFAGWTAAQVRRVLGESGQGWCTLDEAYTDTLSDSTQVNTIEDESITPSLHSVASSVELDSASASELGCDADAEGNSDNELDADSWVLESGLTPTPNIEDHFILPTLDFSSSFAQAASHTQSPALPPEITLRTASELAADSTNAWSPMSPSPLSSDSLSDLGVDTSYSFSPVTQSGMERSWVGLGMELSSSFAGKLDALIGRE